MKNLITILTLNVAVNLPLFAASNRDQEQDAEIRRRRLAHALLWREIAGLSERIELAAGTDGPFLIDAAALLARSIRLGRQVVRQELEVA